MHASSKHHLQTVHADLCCIHGFTYRKQLLLAMLRDLRLQWHEDICPWLSRVGPSRDWLQLGTRMSSQRCSVLL